MNEIILEKLIPIYSVIVIAYILKRRGLYSSNTDKFLNTLAFYIMLPLVIIKSIAYHPIEINNDVLLTLSYLLLSFTIFFSVSLYKKNDLSYMIMALRGNTVYLGIPLLEMFLPEKLISNGIIFTSLLSPLTLVLIGILDQKSSLKKKILDIFLSPFLIALIIGFTLNNINFTPLLLETILNNFTTPLFFISLLIIGGNLDFDFKESFNSCDIFSLIYKLLLLPALFLLFARIFNISPLYSKIGLILYSAPAAVTNYTIIKNMKLRDSGSTKGIIIGTTIYLLSLPILYKIFSLI